MQNLSEKISKLGLALPPPAKAVAAYAPFVVIGSLVFISGQLPLEQGKIAFTGLVGKDLDLAAGQKAARLCGLNILAQLNQACGGDAGRIERCVKLGGFIASAEGFFDHPKVMNGASELMELVFGENGRHARFAIGVSNLPMNAAVEVDAIFALRG
jgi:enamine deaminase RidA (YjgF/YER057c/UK114 family)